MEEVIFNKVSRENIHFLCCVCKSFLPTALALTTKKVQIDIKCSWCRVDIEDVIHVLFEWKFVRSVWEVANMLDLVQIFPNDEFFDVF